jgi:hypothetical protein
VVNSTSQPHFTPGKDPVPIVQEAGWAPGPVWTGGKSRATGIRSPNCPARISVAIPTELPDPTIISVMNNIFTFGLVIIRILKENINYKEVHVVGLVNFCILSMTSF